MSRVLRRLAAELLADHDRIDILANNAGGMFATRTVSPDGREMTFQVNHLAPFLLTNLLLPSLTRAPDGARVINTASSTYRRGRLDLDDLDGTRSRYRSQPAYAASKLATVLFTQDLRDVRKAPASPPRASIPAWWPPTSAATALCPGSS